MTLLSALSRSWYTWLLCTGIGLGCSFSSKWVGIFTIATIGLSTVKQLWDTLGDLQVSKVKLID
jgi:dolichyl-phosphate-mannose-protein mannosyltransferase